MISTIESERAKNAKFAQENNISEEEMEKVYEEILANLPENLTGDKRIKRALRKTRGTFKKQANVSGKVVDGFILMRFRDNTFELNAWNKVDKYVKENGIDDAKSNNLVNEDGEYLHSSLTTSFTDQHGKIIDKKNVRGSAIAIVTNDDGINELRWLTIGKFNVNDNIPLCREVKLTVKEANQPGPLFSQNAYFLNGVNLAQSNRYFSDEEYQQYQELIDDLCGDIRYSTKEEVDEFAESNSTDRNNYIVVPVSSVLRIGNVLDNGSVPIDFELDDDVITAWADKNIFAGLAIEEDIPGDLFLNTYVNKEGVPGYRVGGFLPLDD